MYFNVKDSSFWIDFYELKQFKLEKQGKSLQLLPQLCFVLLS